MNCDLFPFPEEEYAQIPGEGDGADADMLPLDVERCHIIHTLAGPHFLPVKFGAQATAVLQSMGPEDLVQLSRSRPIAPGSSLVKTKTITLYNGRLRGHDFETEDRMTNEKMARLDTGRVVQKDIKQSDSDPVPEADWRRWPRLSIQCGNWTLLGR